MQERSSSSTAGPGFADTWRQSQKHLSNSVEHFYNSVMAANRAMFPTLAADGDERQPAASPELTYSKESWTFERSGEAGEGVVTVGDCVRFSKRLTDDEIRLFADASGDTNRLHLDEEYAAGTRFGRRIVHGTLVGGLVSAALARLPGLTIYLSQDLSFLSPVDVGERVTAECTVVDAMGPNKYELTTDVFGADDEQVIEGQAVVLVDELPETTQVEYEAIA